MPPTSDESCRDVAALAERINSIAEKSRQTESTLLNAIAEFKALLKDHAEEMKANMSEVKTDMNSLANQTNTQETRLALVERTLDQQGGKVSSLEDTVAAHGRRLAQVALVIGAVSLVAPVAMEYWLGRETVPTTSEAVKLRGQAFDLRLGLSS